MNCPHCLKEINIGKLIGSVKSEKKAASSRINGLSAWHKKISEIVSSKTTAQWVKEFEKIDKKLEQRCQGPYCNSIGRQVSLRGVKAWLCEEHIKANGASID